MKRITLCLCTMLVVLFARVCGSTQIGDLQSLPIGSHAAVNVQIDKEISSFTIHLATPPVRNMMQSVPYNTNMGTLESAMRTTMSNFFNSVIGTNEVGTTNWFTFDLVYRSAPTWYFRDNYTSPFTTAVGVDGKLIIPYSQLLYPTADPYNSRSWCLSGYEPVSGAAVGVERTDYILAGGGVISTRNGTTCPALTNLSDLYLLPGWLGCDCLQNITLWYSVAGGQYDVFSATNGAKVYSTVVRLSQTVSNGVPYTLIKGWPGKQVSVETSTNLTTWADAQTVTLDQNGDGKFPSPKLQETGGGTVPLQQLFVRGRLLSP